MPDKIGFDPVEDALLLVYEAVFELVDSNSERACQGWLKRARVRSPRLVGVLRQGSSAYLGPAIDKWLLPSNNRIESFVDLVPDRVIRELTRQYIVQVLAVLLERATIVLLLLLHETVQLLRQVI